MNTVVGESREDADLPAPRVSRPDGHGQQPRPTGRAPRSHRFGPQFVISRVAIVLIPLAVLGLGIVALFTPVLGVRTVEVTGLRGLTVEQVRGAAAVRYGTPLPTLDCTSIAYRIAALPRVALVRVYREWPTTVRVDITERVPVGAMRQPDGTHLVDDSGFDYATVPSTAAAGLPVIQLRFVAPRDPLTEAVVRVLTELPAWLRSEVIAVDTDTPGGVRLALASGKIVRWGGVEQPDRKAAVLAVLLTRAGTVYDVSSPDLPTVS